MNARKGLVSDNKVTDSEVEEYGKKKKSRRAKRASGKSEGGQTPFYPLRRG